MGSAIEAIEKKGYFKAHVDANKVYMEQPDLVKQAKAHLAKLDGTTSKGTGSSKKSTKNPKETADAASQADPVYKLNTSLTSSRPKKLQRRPRPMESKLLWTCSSSTQTCC
jgi:hypothetical protein